MTIRANEIKKLNVTQAYYNYSCREMEAAEFRVIILYKSNKD